MTFTAHYCLGQSVVFCFFPVWTLVLLGEFTVYIFDFFCTEIAPTHVIYREGPFTEADRLVDLLFSFFFLFLFSSSSFSSLLPIPFPLLHIFPLVGWGVLDLSLLTSRRRSSLPNRKVSSLSSSASKTIECQPNLQKTIDIQSVAMEKSFLHRLQLCGLLRTPSLPWLCCSSTSSWQQTPLRLHHIVKPARNQNWMCCRVVLIAWPPIHAV